MFSPVFCFVLISLFFSVGGPRKSKHSKLMGKSQMSTCRALCYFLFCSLAPSLTLPSSSLSSFTAAILQSFNSSPFFLLCFWTCIHSHVLLFVSVFNSCAFTFSPCPSQVVTPPLQLLAVPLQCPTAMIPWKVAAIQVYLHYKYTVCLNRRHTQIYFTSISHSKINNGAYLLNLVFSKFYSLGI